MVGGIASVKTELSKIAEDAARISDFEIFSNEEMMRLLNIEKERRNVKIAEMSMNKKAYRNNKFKKKKEK